MEATAAVAIEGMERGFGPVGAAPRRAILAACRSLLRANGYDRLSMELVAARSGYSRRTVYNQFADRDALYRACRLELIEEVEATLLFDFCGASPLAATERFCRLAMASYQHPGHQDLILALATDHGSRNWLQQIYCRRIRDPMLVRIERYLLELSFRGEVTAPDLAREAERLLRAIEAVSRHGPGWGGADSGPVFTADEIAALFLARLSNAPVSVAVALEVTNG